MVVRDMLCNGLIFRKQFVMNSSIHIPPDTRYDEISTSHSDYTIKEWLVFNPQRCELQISIRCFKFTFDSPCLKLIVPVQKLFLQPLNADESSNGLIAAVYTGLLLLKWNFGLSVHAVFSSSNSLGRPGLGSSSRLQFAESVETIFNLDIDLSYMNHKFCILYLSLLVKLSKQNVPQMRGFRYFHTIIYLFIYFTFTCGQFN